MKITLNTSRIKVLLLKLVKVIIFINNKVMTQENEELLLKDLCARLPYNVKIHAKGFDLDTNTDIDKVGVLSMIDSDTVVAFTTDDTNCYTYINIHEIKPYLFPLSSMTEEQEQEWYQTWVQPMLERLSPNTRKEDLILQAKAQWFGTDWLNENHFDYRGLIPADAAIDATGLDIY